MKRHWYDVQELRGCGGGVEDGELRGTDRGNMGRYI